MKKSEVNRKSLAGVHTGILNDKKGITLVALVVTVIILLILAGISIAGLTGNGLFEKAKLAKEKQKNVQNLEDQLLKEYENKMGGYVDGIRDQDLLDNSEVVIGKSENIVDFKPEVSVVKAHFINIKANVSTYNNKSISGYIYVINGKIQEMTKDSEITLNLQFDTEYKIKVIAIDEDVRGKNSEIVTVNTEKEVYILNGNDIASTITGGYNALFSSSDTTWNNCSLSNTGYNMLVSRSGNYGVLATKNKIDLTNVKSIVLDFSATANNQELINSIFLGISDSVSADGDFIKSKDVTGVTPINRQSITLDVSDIVGEHYVKIAVYHGTNVSEYTTYADIYSILMR